MARERYHPKNVGKLLIVGVTKAIANVNDIIAPALIKSGIDVKDQKAIDKFLIDLDGTPNKCTILQLTFFNSQPNSVQMQFLASQWPALVLLPLRKYNPLLIPSNSRESHFTRTLQN